MSNPRTLAAQAVDLLRVTGASDLSAMVGNMAIVTNGRSVQVQRIIDDRDLMGLTVDRKSVV